MANYYAKQRQAGPRPAAKVRQLGALCLAVFLRGADSSGCHCSFDHSGVPPLFLSIHPATKHEQKLGAKQKKREALRRGLQIPSD